MALLEKNFEFQDFLTLIIGGTGVDASSGSRLTMLLLELIFSSDVSGDKRAAGISPAVTKTNEKVQM